MSQPKYFSLKKFTDIAKIDDGVLADDFVHDGNETWKFKAKTQKGSTIDFKSKTNFANKEKNQISKMTEEISFKFPFANRFWMAIDSKSNGSIKLHLDAGTHKCKLTNKDVNLWGSIDTIKDHSMFNFNLGANIFTKDLDISSRISSKPNENCNLCFTTKVLKRFGNFFLGGMVCEKLCPSFKICNFDSVFGYEKDNMKFYLRHLTPECSTQTCQKGEEGKCCPIKKLCSLVPKPGQVLATAIFKHKKLGLGMEAGYDFQKKTPSLTAGAEYECCSKMKLKSKVDLGMNVSLAGRYKICDQLTVKAATKIPVLQWKTFTYGFDWEVNL